MPTGSFLSDRLFSDIAIYRQSYDVGAHKLWFLFSSTKKSQLT